MTEGDDVGGVGQLQRELEVGIHRARRYYRVTRALLYLCAGYLLLQRVVLFVPHQFELTRVDAAIPFDPRWTFVYLSIAPALLFLRSERYRRGFYILATICFLFFLAFPVEGPRPDVMVSSPVYRLLIAVDRNLNAFPSLHAALAVYTLLFLRRYRALAAIWTALLLYSELATKQHYGIDVVAGIIVGAAAHALSSRPR